MVVTFHARPLSTVFSRPQWEHDAPLVVDACPELVALLRAGLRSRKEEALAQSLDSLRVVEPCACTIVGCDSFYTVRRSQARRAWLEDGRTIDLPARTGYLAVDVAHGSLVSVELIGRTDLGERIAAATGRTPATTHQRRGRLTTLLRKTRVFGGATLDGTVAAAA